MTRIESLLSSLQPGVGYLIVTPVNRRYLTGFPSSLGYLLLGGGEALLFMDGRYFEAASKAAAPPVSVVQTKQLSEQLAEAAGRMGLSTVFTETEITVRTLEELRRLLPGRQVEASQSLTDRLEDMRTVKTPDEAQFIQRAQGMAEAAFLDILNMIRPGVAEADIALELDYRMRKAGAEDLAFETIAVAGANASLPHGVPGAYKVQAGDFVVMDFGAVCGGYRSDMTRTVAVGYADEEMRRVYDTVLAAQEAALAVLRPGLSCAEGDRAARSVIEKAGYGDCFSHSTGHGVGLEIHEKPNLSGRSQAVLEAGQVVTVEPGIYLPGKCGVRIEDMVYLTAEGCENLTKAPKELLIV
ncbi:MAG: aminopeptidase P family protein [Clostridiales bacterium]|nr:aminopeptidase P family protein [Clostridiales bacterium]